MCVTTLCVCVTTLCVRVTTLCVCVTTLCVRVCLCLQDEINTVPFFDVQLPRELALIIFGYLGMQDLGRCAAVSESLSLLPHSSTWPLNQQFV